MASNIRGSFFGRHTTAFAGNVFMIFVSDEGLHLGRVADRFTKELLESQNPTTNLLLTGLGGLIVNQAVHKPAVKHREALEAKYLELEIGGSEFLAVDKRNYNVKKEEIASVILQSGNFLTKTSQSVGVLILELKDGRKLKFQLASPRTPNQIQELIKSVFPDAQGSLS